MRRVKYNEYKDQIKAKAVAAVRLVDRSAPRRRTRDQGEVDVLLKLALLSWSNAVSSGKLQKKGARRYSLNINAG